MERAVRILVVEDDRSLSDFLRRALADEGMDATVCETASEALEVGTREIFDAVILDWMLPDGDGVASCKTLRDRGNTTPLLMLTARGQVQDRVSGLKSGADDYLVKPFELDELLARVQALVRRSYYVSTLKRGPLEIDRLGRRVKLDGKVLDLTSIEYRLLVRLAIDTATVQRAAILRDVWGLARDPGSGLVEVHVSRLRDKLGENAWIVETVRGTGYRIRSDRAPAWSRTRGGR